MLPGNPFLDAFRFMSDVVEDGVGMVYPVKGFGNIGKAATTYACLADNETAVLVLTDFMDSKSPCPVAGGSQEFCQTAWSTGGQNFISAGYIAGPQKAYC
ncbi:hypothetical protein [Desulfovibrio piger]|uniref:hypothetical protein n=1 Tax=Desulfovibrio piger TaxID=901 RepID=UPI0011C9406E|nr:hypothetical protein [Desulfovibrio piger]